MITYEKKCNKENTRRGIALYPSPVGMLRLEFEGGFVTSLGRAEDADAEELSVYGGDCICGSGGDNSKECFAVFAQLDEYFSGVRKNFDFPCKLRGTSFQIKVWSALCDIPYGETRSYREIAEAVGSPRAYRAVGMANKRNPVAIVVPCHRVVGADGSLVGYDGGLDMKRTLLELERRPMRSESL